MLPEGVKSLAEIAEYHDPVDRVPHFGRLLEHLLKNITPNGRFETFERLLRLHAPKFSNFDRVDDARRIRNWVVHGEQVTRVQILQAEASFDQAIQDIFPHCSQTLHQDAVGLMKPKAQPKPEPPRPPQPEPPPPQPTPIFPAPHHHQISPPPPPPIDPAPWAKSGAVWFLVAGFFVVAAAVAYVLRSQPPHPRIIYTADQTQSPQSPQPLTSPSELPRHREVVKSASPIDSQAQRDDEFRRLINTNLSLSSSQPNVAILIETTSSEGGSVSDSLQGFLSNVRVRLIGNFSDIRALRQAGFFDDLYSGNGRFLSQAAKLSRVDYILLGKAGYSFRRQSSVDPDLLTCDLSLSCRLTDRTGTMIQSGDFHASGPGFTQTQSLDRAAELVAQQLKEKLLDSIP